MTGKEVDIPESYLKIINPMIQTGEYKDLDAVLRKALDSFFRFSETKVQIAYSLLKLEVEESMVKAMMLAIVPGSPRVTNEAVSRAKVLLGNHWDHIIGDGDTDDKES